MLLWAPFNRVAARPMEGANEVKYPGFVMMQ
jgi:hypothetical protein